MKKHLSHSLLQNIKTEDLLVKKAFFLVFYEDFRINRDDLFKYQNICMQC